MSKGSVQTYIITDVGGAVVATIEVRVSKTRAGHFFQEWLIASWKQLATIYSYKVTQKKAGGD
jgi:hypothetical protein